MELNTPQWKSRPFEPGSEAYLYEVVFLPAPPDRKHDAWMATTTLTPPLSLWISHRIHNSSRTLKTTPKESSFSDERDGTSKIDDAVLHNCNFTRIGVLFSSNLGSDCFETVLDRPLNAQNSSFKNVEGDGNDNTVSRKQSVLVRLTNRTKLLYNNENGHEDNNDDDDDCTVLSCQKLQALIQFNQTLMKWKNYGDDYARKMRQQQQNNEPLAPLRKQKQSADISNDDKEENDDGSTCLFCPLLHRKDCGSALKGGPSGGTTGYSTEQGHLVIDWNVIELENSLQTTCLLDVTRQAEAPLSITNYGPKLLHSLDNRIVYHRRIRYRLLARKQIKQHPQIPLTAKSPFPDPHTATYEEYFEKRHGMTVQYPDEPLWEARRVVKMTAEEPSILTRCDSETPGTKHASSNNIDWNVENNMHDERSGSDTDEDKDNDEIVHLIPELVNVLPIPLDFLFVFNELTKRCMPQLEREIDVCLQAQWLEEQVTQSFSQIPQQVVCNDNPYRQWLGRYFDLAQQQEQPLHRPLSHLLDEATSLFPRSAYERLEFLGDAVLGFILAVVGGMSRNSSLEWACDEYKDYISNTGRNKNLAKAARQCHLENCLYTRRIPFESTYRERSANSKTKKKAAPTVANSTLSDCVESLLGAAYLTGKSNKYCTDGELVIYLLERFQLLDAFDSSLSTTATRCCLEHGYPFAFDSQWEKTLQEVVLILRKENEIDQELSEGCHHLLSILCSDAPHCAAVEYLRLPWAKLLLQCALFDDALEDASLFSSSDRDEFEKVALVRDTLYIVGAFALQLMMSNEVYQRYPDATPGDMHLARACVMADDVIAYILIKSRCHEALFDKHSPCLFDFQVEMKHAEELGEEKWRAQYETMTSDSKGDALYYAHAHTTPRYPGLVGGRLQGHNKKIPEETTDELMFSFKAIAGALVLSLGADGMWSLLGPFFEELLTISPDELRLRYSKESSLVRAYCPNAKSSPA